MSDTIQLNPSEDNELCFEISIEGSTTKESLDKSIFRFNLSEQHLGEGSSLLSYTFPATKTGTGTVQVLIPRINHMIKEETSYLGTLEVIIGGQYFVPQTINVNFQRPITVESKSVVVNHKPISQTSTSENKQIDFSPNKVTSKMTGVVSSLPHSQPANTSLLAAKSKFNTYSPEKQIKIRNKLIEMKKLQEQKFEDDNDVFDISIL